MLATALAVFAFQQATISVEAGSKGTFVKITAHEREPFRKDTLEKRRRSTAITPEQMA